VKIKITATETVRYDQEIEVTPQQYEEIVDAWETGDGDHISNYIDRTLVDDSDSFEAINVQVKNDEV